MNISALVQAIVLSFIVTLSRASDEESNTNNSMELEGTAQVEAAQLRGSAGDNTHRELRVDGTSNKESCAYKYYEKKCTRRGFLNICTKREWKWHNEYMWCVEREGTHSMRFRDEIGGSTVDYTKLVFDDKCSETDRCKDRTDIGTGTCTNHAGKFGTGDWNASWQKYKC